MYFDQGVPSIIGYLVEMDCDPGQMRQVMWRQTIDE